MLPLRRCLAVPALYIAKETAEGVLAAAAGVLQDVVEGAVGLALDAAQDTLNGAQTAVDDVLDGAEWLTLEAANATLDTAESWVNQVLAGVNYTACQAASGVSPPCAVPRRGWSQPRACGRLCQLLEAKFTRCT